MKLVGKHTIKKWADEKYLVIDQISEHATDELHRYLSKKLDEVLNESYYLLRLGNGMRLTKGVLQAAIKNVAIPRTATDLEKGFEELKIENARLKKELSLREQRVRTLRERNEVLERRNSVYEKKEA